MKSQHAEIRQKQRGISDEVIDLAIRFGKEYYSYKAFVYFVTKRTMARIHKTVGDHRVAEQCAQVYVVITDGAIVTVGHRYKPIRHR
jgi:hypothetical protein